MSMPDEDPDLLAVLQDYKKEIEAEYDAIKSGDISGIKATLQELAQGSALVMLHNLIGLGKNSSSESVKRQAILDVLKIAVGEWGEGGKGGGSAIDSMIAKLMADSDDE